MKNIVEIYWIIDEVVKRVDKDFSKNARGRKNILSKTELMTIAIIGHFEAIPTEKLLYERIKSHFYDEFKKMPSYEQFTRGFRSVLKYFDFILTVLCSINLQRSIGSNLFIVDSTALPTNGYDKYNCPKWASEVKTGKNIFGYYHGFKLHIIINRNLEVVSYVITPANVHDVKALSIDHFTSGIQGRMVGDKGYVMSQKDLYELAHNGIDFIFKQRENMDPYLNEYYRKELSQRQVIEGVFSYLKNRLNILHKFARSVESFLVHVKAALAAYMLRNLENLLIYAI
jgi:hypothetical protein